MTHIRGAHAGPIYDLALSVFPCANLNQLTDLRAPDVEAGSLAWVQSLRAAFVLDRSGTESPVDGQLVAAGDGVGLWRRMRPFWRETPPWRDRTEWYIDATNGSVEGDGSAGSPISSWSEFQQRLAGGIVGRTTVHILTDLDEVLDCETLTETGRWDDPESTFLYVTGEQGAQAVLTTEITAWTDPNAVANEWALLEAAGVADWSGYVGSRIAVLDGPAAGSVCYVGTADPAGAGLDVARVSQPAQLAWPYIFTPAVGNTIAIQTLPQVRGFLQAPLLAEGSGTVFTGLHVDAGFFPVTALARGTSLFMDRCIIADGRLTAADYVYATGCRFGGTAFPYFVLGGSLVDTIGCLYFGDECMVDTRFAHAQACLWQGGLKLWSGSNATLQSCGIFDGAGNAVSFQDFYGDTRAVLSLAGDAILGKGNAGYGVDVPLSGTVVNYAALPIVTGATGDARITGVPFAWGALPPAVNALGSGIVTP